MSFNVLSRPENLFPLKDKFEPAHFRLSRALGKERGLKNLGLLLCTWALPDPTQNCMTKSGTLSWLAAGIRQLGTTPNKKDLHK